MTYKFAGMNAIMKKGVLMALFLFFLCAACSKDKYESKPTLKLLSINGNVIPKQMGSGLALEFEFTDKEGDVDDTLYIVRQRLNVKGPVTMPAFNFDVPTFPHQSKGELHVELDYTFHLTVGLNPIGQAPNFEPDTMIYKFVLKDKQNNLSDTVAVGPIIVIR
jgi:hypothetical protein